jgi:exopolysaccharide biosynthesis polyprenyl glycosylphosphotransferase
MSTLSLPATPDLREAADGAAPAPRRWSKSSPPRRPGGQALVAVSATAAAVVAAGQDRPAVWAALTLLVYAATGIGVRRATRWAAMLPLTRAVIAAAQPLGAGAALLVGGSVAGLAGTSWQVALAGSGAAAAAALFSHRQATRRPVREERIVVVGPADAAHRLRRELADAGRAGYVLVGSIEVEDDPRGLDGHGELLGTMAALDVLVEEHAVDLLLVAPGASRPEVYERIADCCLDRPVGVCELPEFYETTFGHVPAAEIDGAWFRHVMHPSFRSPDTHAKRALDLAVALTVALIFMPVLLVCAALIKLHDGGPVFFAQRRIGAGGRPFTLLKLRSMRVEPTTTAWSSAHDPRVTPIGRLMRRTHIDELPQLLNIVRGEMSIIGPRPEQPEFVERLERGLRYYNRRHLIKPGLTGWAQVRCGYAGSDEGSALKLCHDLFYLRHRSFGLDLAILLETVGTLVADSQFPSPAPAPLAASAAAEGRHPALHVLQERALDSVRIERRPAPDLIERGSYDSLTGVELA